MAVKAKLIGNWWLSAGVKKTQQVSELVYTNSSTGQKIQNFSIKH